MPAVEKPQAEIRDSISTRLRSIEESGYLEQTNGKRVDVTTPDLEEVRIIWNGVQQDSRLEFGQGTGACIFRPYLAGVRGPFAGFARVKIPVSLTFVEIGSQPDYDVCMSVFGPLLQHPGPVLRADGSETRRNGSGLVEGLSAEQLLNAFNLYVDRAEQKGLINRGG